MTEPAVFCAFCGAFSGEPSETHRLYLRAPNAGPAICQTCVGRASAAIVAHKAGSEVREVQA